MNYHNRWQTYVLFALLVVAVSWAGIAEAQWSRDPNQNTNPLPAGFSGQASSKQSVTDGMGGIITGWVHESGVVTYRAQRVDSSGFPLWGAAGSTVIGDASALVGPPHIAPDGNGGFFLAWSKDVGNYTLVLAQHVDGSGNPTWNAGGVGMQQLALVGTVQMNPQIASDGNGGAIVSWIDESDPGSDDVRATRINSAGTRLWSSATVALTPYDVENLVMVEGQAPGEVCLAWNENIGGDRGWDIYGQILFPDGTISWQDWSQAALCERNGDQQYPQLVSFGNGGLMALWYDFANSQYYYGAKNDDGTNQFGSNGYGLTGMYEFQQFARLTEGQNQDAFIVFEDASNTPGGAVRIAAKYFQANVDWTWGQYGKTIHEAECTGNRIDAMADPSGGLFVVLNENNLINQLSSYHINALGEPTWPEGNRIFSTRITWSDTKVDLVPDGNAGFVAGWLGIDIQAWAYIPAVQKIDYNGFMADNGFSMTSVADRPNDQGGEIIASWQASPLDNSLDQAITGYSVWVEDLGTMGAAKANRSQADSPIPAAELAGMLKMNESDVVKLQTAGWVFVSQVPALFASEYSAFCPGFGDSTTAGSHLTGVKVVAHHEDSSIFWTSTTMAGYSVDNLAPGAPLGLAGVNNSGLAHLTWSASGSHDEDLAQYRVYRGTEPGFVQNESTLVGNSLTTNFTDESAAGTVYYRVTGVDVHGNEGDASAEVMVQLAVSGVDALPTTFRHGGNYPNPFNPMTRIAFDLPKTAQVRVSVFNAAGQLVTTLISESLNAGHHEVRWNGQDSTGHSVSSGVYFSRVDAGEFTATRSMMLVR